MATVKTRHRGNTALQTEMWTLPVDEAVRVSRVLDCRTGTYWYTNFWTVYLRATRAKSTTVVIWTAGFSTSDFSNALHISGSIVTRIEAA